MSELEERAAAALARREGIKNLADRPSQRRWAEHHSKPTVRFRSKIIVRDSGGDADTVGFTGIASAYESPYEMYDMFGPYTEIVSLAAGAKSLANPDLNVPLVLGHDSLRRLACTTIAAGQIGALTLSETSDGLQVDAPSIDARDADAAYIMPKLRSGLIDEMSFMFRIIDGQWSPDYTEFRINAYDIDRGDVSIVGFGANPATTAEARAETRDRVARASAEPVGLSLARLRLFDA